MEQQLEVLETKSVKLSAIFIQELILSTERWAWKFHQVFQFQTVHTHFKSNLQL